MKKLLLSGVALVALAVGPALAADLPRKAPAYQPPPPPPPLTWNGFYIGLNAGATWSDDNLDNTVAPANVPVGWPHGNPLATTNAHLAAITGALNGSGDNSNNKVGFIGGGQIGYNWQFTNWVVGVEADFQGIGNNSNDNNIGFVTSVPVAATPGFLNEGTYNGLVAADADLKWLGTLRARLGWLATPSALIYATGGLAYGKVEVNGLVDVSNTTSQGQVGPGHLAIAGSTAFSEDKTRAGWTVGAGVEWMFAPSWSLKAEYLFYDLGHVDTDYTLAVTDFQPGSAGTATFAGHSSVDVKGHIARAGINWHFSAY